MLVRTWSKLSRLRGALQIRVSAWARLSPLRVFLRHIWRGVIGINKELRQKRLASVRSRGGCLAVVPDLAQVFSEILRGKTRLIAAELRLGWS
ncbi:MAG: hypothetical protein ACKESB_02690 [Candidatus Hodgkinia cicadicola]